MTAIGVSVGVKRQSGPVATCYEPGFFLEPAKGFEPLTCCLRNVLSWLVVVPPRSQWVELSGLGNVLGRLRSSSVGGVGVSIGVSTH